MQVDILHMLEVGRNDVSRVLNVSRLFTVPEKLSQENTIAKKINAAPAANTLRQMMPLHKSNSRKGNFSVI